MCSAKENAEKSNNFCKSCARVVHTNARTQTQKLVNHSHHFDANQRENMLNMHIKNNAHALTY